MNEKVDLVLSKTTNKTAVKTTYKTASKTTVKTAEQGNKTAPNGMPVYDINEPWVQQYIADFGCKPSFF